MIYEEFVRLPLSHYGAIMADPPWAFKSWTDAGKNRSPDFMVNQKGLAERHYKTMGMVELHSMPVGTLGARDCMLFLWCVDCMLDEAIALGFHWGFKFKTVAFTWAKTTKEAHKWGLYHDRAWHKSMGYWTRGNPETCLLFTKGHPKRKSAAVRQLIVAQRRQHSRKPEEARARIEQLVDGPYLDLFSRESRPGWDIWGNQAGKFDGESGQCSSC